MEITKAPRPKVIGGITVKVLTGCGAMYVQMNWCNGKLFEVFATLGKTGGCATSQSEALTRSVTNGLRHGVPLSEYVRQLRGIRCPSPMHFPKDDAVLSCPDALAKTLAEYGSLPIDKVIDLIRATNSNGAVIELDSEAEAMQRIQEMTQEREEQGLR